jgi:serine/threonine protein phosphatase PrpC
VCCLRGEAKELNKEHGPNDPIESNRIRQVGGEIVYGRVNGGLNVSRAFGSFSYKSVNLKPEEQMITPCPDVLKIKNKDIDYIIMGCDGIWEVKSNADMVSWISERLAKSISP